MTGAYLHNTGNSMTRTESEVMRRWDAGASDNRIAREMPLPLCRVKQIVSRFYDAGEQARDERAVATGTADLLAAIAAAKELHQPTGERNG